MAARPVLYGEPDSVYVRIARLTLEEKRVVSDLVPVDAFAEGGPPADYLRLHPFGRIPAFEHDGFTLYETTAITRYIDEAFDGPSLQPVEPRLRARMNQLIGIADCYFYRSAVWDVFVERINKPMRGDAADEAKIARGLAQARTCLGAICDVATADPWLLEEMPGLADLHLAPMVYYFMRTPEGRATMENFPALERWWERMARRPSMSATAFE